MLSAFFRLIVTFFFGTYIAWFEGSCYRVHPQDLDNATMKVSLPHWTGNDCCCLWSII